MIIIIFARLMAYAASLSVDTRRAMAGTKFAATWNSSLMQLAVVEPPDVEEQHRASVPEGFIPERGGDPKRTAVVFLVTRMEYVDQLKTSLKLLRDNWLSRFPVASVVIFHSSNTSYATRNVIHSTDMTDRTQMVQITPTIPKYVEGMKCPCCCNGLKKPVGGVRGARFNMEYCGMNRFRTYEMYRHPALASFDYFVQLDTDTNVEKPMPYNPVERMAAAGAVFGFYHVEVRPDKKHDCNDDMYESIDRWIKRSSLSPKYYPPRGTSYTGNFNIGDLRFLRSEQYYSFARWINDEEKGIWSKRWGDQAFLPNILGVYFPEQKHMLFSDLYDERVLCHYSNKLGRKR